MPGPDLTTAYYFRNVRTGKYLTGNSSTNINYVTPSDKTGSTFQQWKIFLVQPGNSFYIQNVGNSQYLAAGTYSSSYNGWYSVCATATSCSFSVAQLAGSAAWNIIFNASYYVHDEDGGIYIVAQNYSYSKNQQDRRQWYLDPVSVNAAAPIPSYVPMIIKNPLPKGVYRIRCFSNNYLLTMPKTAGASPYVTKQIPGDTYQRWLITPQPNGLYTISNSGKGLYLAGSSSNLVEGAPLIGQSIAAGEASFQWNIQTFNPGVMFFIGLPDVHLSVGFANYEAEDSSVVALESSDNIPSQIWFFETFKQLSPAIFHEKRFLEPGKYKIELLHDNHYLTVDSSDNLSSASTRGSAAEFIIAYADDTVPHFTIYHSDSDGKLFIYGDQDRIKTSEDRKTQWVVLPLEHEDGATAYHICDAVSADPRTAISSRIITDRKKLFFALDPLAEQEVMQLFRFHEAS